jgi:DNA adenine methylase
MKNKIYPPFAWIGGKRKLAKQIIEIMPPHQKYIEVFGGGLAVLYQKEKLSCRDCIEVINDFNSELINLHQVIQKYPQTLSDRFSELLISRDLFSLFKEQVEFSNISKIDRAIRYLYLLSYSFGSRGESFAMTKSIKPKSLIRDFRIYSKRLQNVQIENLSFEKLIREYDREDVLFYLDPPYYETERYYSNSSFSKDSHILLFETLNNIKGKFVLSYNSHSFIKQLYPKFNQKEISTNYSLNIKRVGDEKKELIITNF